MNTREVLDHHLAAFSTGDVEGVLKWRSDDSILIAPDATFKGTQALQGAFTAFFASLFKPGTYDFVLDTVRVEEELAYLVWHASGASADVVFGTDTFVIRNGQIVGHTFAAKIDPK